MAVLQRIRNHSVALLVIVGFAMAAFIIGDLLTSSSSIMQSSRDKVVTIDGDKVTYEQFEVLRQRKSEFYKTMMGQDLDNNASQQLTQTVYSECVIKNLLNKTCEDLGLSVTDDEINELVQGEHISPILTQYFGEQAPSIAQFFTNLIVNDSFEEASAQYPFATRSNWMEIEDEIALSRLVEKYQGLVAAAVKPNKLEALDNFNGDNEECSFAYVKLNAFNVADSAVKVSSDAVKNYYNATKRNYKLNTQTRDISYIAVKLRPSQADFDAVKADMEAVREEFSTASDVADLVNSNSLVSYIDAFVNNNSFSGDLKAYVDGGNTAEILEPSLQDGTIYMMARIMDKTVAPDSLNISMVVVPTQAEADSIKDLLAKTPDTALAGYSQQQAFTGWVTEAFAVQQFGKEVSDKINGTAKGQIFTHNLTQGTNSIFFVGKVNDATKPVAKSKVAVYALEVTPSSATRRDEFGKLNQFLTDNKSIKDMVANATDAGFFMMPTTIAATAYNIGQVTDARQAVRFAFQNSKGDVSEIFECDDNLLVVAITGDIQEGYMNLNDTTFYKQVASAYALPAAKVAKLVNDINATADKSLAGVASAFEAKVDTARFVNFNLSSVSGLGIEPSVLAAATKAAPGTLVGPIAGRNAAVMLQVIDKNNKELEYDVEARKQTVANSRDYIYLGSAALSALQNAADIEDNRINFY